MPGEWGECVEASFMVSGGVDVASRFWSVNCSHIGAAPNGCEGASVELFQPVPDSPPCSGEGRRISSTSVRIVDADRTTCATVEFFRDRGYEALSSDGFAYMRCCRLP